VFYIFVFSERRLAESYSEVKAYHLHESSVWTERPAALCVLKVGLRSSLRTTMRSVFRSSGWTPKRSSSCFTLGFGVACMPAGPEAFFSFSRAFR
jgi:hypothetical protein